MKLVKAAFLTGTAMVGAGALCAAASAAAIGAVLSRAASRRLGGKVVLITGGSRGLGLALAEAFGRRGARLVLVARDPYELERARQSLAERRVVRDAADVLVVPADLRRPEEAAAAIGKATEICGRIDILVNNAGIMTVGPVENQSVEDFHDVMESNFFSGVHCALSAIPGMLRRGSGTIVNIASIGGKIAIPHMLPYSASKFAVAGFSQGLHAELRSKGVHVLTVCPGLMRTGSHRNAVFIGDSRHEYRWFGLMASLPGVSISAAHAARRIVLAVLLQETEVAVPLHAMVGARVVALAPGIAARAMSVATRALPSPVSRRSEPQAGADVRTLGWPPPATPGSAAAQR